MTEDQPLEITRLKEAWNRFTQKLKEEKNPAAQSFEMAELIIKDPNCFEATASNNINQKFLEFERNKTCAFLQRELGNRQLQFSILLQEMKQEGMTYDRPLSSKEQYQKMIEQYPLVKELKDKLKLDLDF